MRFLYPLCLIATIAPSGVLASEIDLAAAVANVRGACMGISDKINHMKTMAITGTAVTGVGTLAAGGALGVGIAKVGTDKEIAEYVAELRRMGEQQTHVDYIPPMTHADFEKWLTSRGQSVSVDASEHPDDATGAISDTNAKLDAAVKKSKNLGNWRTGLMAGATATNVAGAIISGTNHTDDDLITMIDKCAAAVRELSDANVAARAAGTASVGQMATVQSIINACDGFAKINLGKIDSRARGATISGGIGAGTGLVGTITSAIANTDKTRASDGNRERNLNMAANILAGTTTVASGVATVFNATQIAAINDAIKIADKCEGALK